MYANYYKKTKMVSDIMYRLAKIKNVDYFKYLRYNAFKVYINKVRIN